MAGVRKWRAPTDEDEPNKRPGIDIEIAGRYVKARRTCLRCHAEFDSAWAGNRLCHGCAEYAAQRAGAIE